MANNHATHTDEVISAYLASILDHMKMTFGNGYHLAVVVAEKDKPDTAFLMGNSRPAEVMALLVRLERPDTLAGKRSPDGDLTLAPMGHGGKH